MIASDLHFWTTGPYQNVTPTVEQNAPGCSQPTAGASFVGSPDFTFRVSVVWPTNCVDPGESVTLRLGCGYTPAATPAPGCTVNVPNCVDWTTNGNQIGSPCPTPNCGGQPCCGGLPCPTPTATPTPSVPTATATVTPTPCGSCTPTATPTPNPNAAGHDARLTRIGGVPKNVRLLPGEVTNDTATITFANQSTHGDSIGIYVDVIAPAAGGCTPNGRTDAVIFTLIAAGAKTTEDVPVSYSCADPAAANGLSYTWVAVADHGGDDLASCGPGALQSLACFNALADDDQDSSDNRVSRNGPRAVAQ